VPLRTAPAPAAARGPSDPAALRAEHDALADRLAARVSILEVRRASIAFFVAVLLLGLTGKLGWDRWGITRPGAVAPAPQHGPALHVWFGMFLTMVTFAVSIRWFLRARTLLAEEAALFERFKALRAELGFDA
jgi:hypothetical protein